MKGQFGRYGGQFVPETLMSPLEELEEAFVKAKDDLDFLKELNNLLYEYAGRPTPITPLKQFGMRNGGAKIYLKREDLLHTGAHKINNALGQALLAKRMGKKRIIAETGAGQHGVAVATVCSLMGLECVIYMGEIDARRQAANVEKMKLLGAEIVLVDGGSKTLKDAINVAIQDWVTNVRNTHYLLGSVAGTHPFPTIVKEFQKIIGKECREQILEREGRLPDYVVACVGGGSNSMGIFSAFLQDEGVRLIAVEAGGKGIETGYHSAAVTAGRFGVIHGCATYLMQNEDGQILEAHSIAPGLDYPAVGPELSYLNDIGRVEFCVVEDQQALEAFRLLSREQGIIPALESSHAIAKALELATKLDDDKIIIVNLSGRGDKDMSSACKALADMEVEYE